MRSGRASIKIFTALAISIRSARSTAPVRDLVDKAFRSLPPPFVATPAAAPGPMRRPEAVRGEPDLNLKSSSPTLHAHHVLCSAIQRTNLHALHEDPGPCDPFGAQVDYHISTLADVSPPHFRTHPGQCADDQGRRQRQITFQSRRCDALPCELRSRRPAVLR